MAEVQIKFLVFNISDVIHYLNSGEITMLTALHGKIENSRIRNGENVNSYWVCNQDEPYADEIIQIILQGEDKKLQKKLQKLEGEKDVN